MPLEVGKELTMHFDCGGFTSHEPLVIVAISDDTIELERDDDDTWVFDKKTGTCYNDNTFAGARRYIDPIKED